MLQYQGWVNLIGHWDEIEELRYDEKLICNKINESVSKTFGSDKNSVFDIHILYGDYKPLICGSRNHSVGTTDDIHEILTVIADIAPGSYGMVYFIDDEDKSGLSDVYQCYVLRKGAIKRICDELFSPTNPMIEE